MDVNLGWGLGGGVEGKGGGVVEVFRIVWAGRGDILSTGKYRQYHCDSQSVLGVEQADF